jgi:DNA-binding protein WhiA
VPPYREKCEELLEFMSDYGLKMKMSQRVSKNNCEAQSFVYCKSCEQIIDFLTFIGATRHSMELMNVTILKEIRNNVNRAVNCESANLDKTARAASKHIANIDYIFSEKGAEYLPEHLRRVAELRKNSVGLSLEEIGRMLTPAISKSGVNHRLNKINGIADKLRNEILEKA